MSNDRYVAAIDQGTTGTRCMLFDRAGHVAGEAYETHEQYYPEPGWVEHDAEEILANAHTVIREALADAGVTGEDVAAVGVTNQRETTVLWDRTTGEPVARAVVWQDRRTTERVEQLEAAGKTDAIRRRTGLEPDAYFSATKAEWLLDEADPIGTDRGDARSLRERAADGEVLFGTIETWLIWNLTGGPADGDGTADAADSGEGRMGTGGGTAADRGGVHVTDVTNASRTMLFDVHDLSWSADLLDEFRVPQACLPEVRPSSDDEPYGHTTGEGPFGARVPVTGALGDQQAALFGQCCFDAGDVKNTYGTGSFVLCNTGPDAVDSDHGLLTTVAFQRRGEPAKYALEGSVFVTGAAIEWLADVDLVDDPADTERLARSVDSTDGVYVVPAFTGLGAPYWDGRARGTVVGLTRGTRKEHLVRATLEAIGYQTRDVVEAMVVDAGVSLNDLRVDGGAVKNSFLCRLQAAILGREVVRPAVDETTALGAAYAAGLGVGYWDDLDDLRANYREDRRFAPDAAGAGVGEADWDARYDRWVEAVDRSLDWAQE
jgi:glycerol kinase